MSTRTIIAVAFTAFALGACGPGVGLDGRAVGGACQDDRDCEPAAECLHGGEFPGGTCALPCGDGNQCPRGTICVEERGGYCLLMCVDDRECRAGYDCSNRRVHDRHGGGRERVCIDD